MKEPRLATFFIAPKNCIFWSASFEPIQNLATLSAYKLQGFHGTLLYYYYTLLFLERTQILSRFQFTMHFIVFAFVETKRFVKSNPNVILTRQTCGQRSCMSAGSKRRAIAFYISIRICHMFLISTCRGESDLSLCTTSVLANRMLLRGGDFQRKNVFHRKICRNLPMRGGILLACTEVVHRSDPTLLNILVYGNIWQIRTQK